MNISKISLAPMAVTVWLLAGCRKEDVRQAPETEAKPAPTKSLPNTPPAAPSARPLVPSPNHTPNVSQSAPQQARRRVMADIASTIGRPEGGLTRGHWLKIKERYWLPSFDKIIRGAGSAATVRDVLATPEGKKPLVVQLLSGVFETQAATEQDSLLALHTMALVTAATDGTSLPLALADRRTDPNITQGDVIMFQVFNDAFQDVPRTEQISQTTLQEWKQLALSSNDLIRLLALRTFRRLAPQPEQWLDFYRSYVNERDQDILAELTDMVFETAKPVAAATLAEIRSRPGPTLPADFVAKLDRSIDFLTKLSSRSQ